LITIKRLHTKEFLLFRRISLLLKNTGLIFLVGGWIVLTFWGIFQGVLESDSLVLTFSLVAVWLGVFILLVRAIVQRRKESENDPYKEIER